MQATDNQLKAVVQKITDLPTLPALFVTLTRLIQDPHTSAFPVSLHRVPQIQHARLIGLKPFHAFQPWIFPALAAEKTLIDEGHGGAEQGRGPEGVYQ